MDSGAFWRRARQRRIFPAVAGWYTGSARAGAAHGLRLALAAVGALGVLALFLSGPEAPQLRTLPAVGPRVGWRWPWARPAPPPSGQREPHAPASPLSGRVVAVDPGHGGEDGGVSYGGMVEKEINLDIARRLGSLLQEKGARVIMTREGDADTFVDPRTSLNLRLHRALQGEAELYVSIHANSYPDPSQFGAQTFYHPRSPQARRLALLVQEELVRIQPDNYREALAADYYVLRNSHCVAVLVEAGFLSSPDDRRRLADPEWRQQVAAAILKGLERFVQGDLPEPERPTLHPGGPPPGFIQQIYPDEVR